jgi:DNA primase small subunit
MMFRHIAFLRREELDSFFRDSVPMHAYYSVAYYGDPALQPMGEKFKTWMGADLIFDLDADHLPDADSMTYPEQLAKVKEEVKRLLFEFILGDLGLPEEHTHLHFSGGRGYHVHVRSPEVLNLDSRDRRQIVDYITGRNIDFDVLFPWKITDVNKRFGSVKKERDFRSRTFGGWVRRTYEGKDALIKDITSFPDKKQRMIRLLEISRERGLEIKEKKCESMIEDLFYKGKGNTAKRMLNEDKFTLTSSKTMDNDFLLLASSYSAINLKGETDEPVTTDIKRLIRCPGSLHGKTGLKVIEIMKEKIDEFDPLRDAVALTSDPVKVELQKDFEMEMEGKDWFLEQGDATVPRYLAYFLVARRIALIS